MFVLDDVCEYNTLLAPDDHTLPQAVRRYNTNPVHLKGSIEIKGTE